VQVYDVTDYVDFHPGGDAILRNAGGDSTAGFYGPQHPPTTRDLIDEYYIGELASDKG
jgi:cytochrome b involved in lipid metabolism